MLDGMAFTMKAYELLIPLAITLYLLVAPYTKVEESFNTQATHDILLYGTPTTNIHARLLALYDHHTFPGAVPRSFIGPVVISGIAQPLVYLAGFHHGQLITRWLLGMMNAAALVYCARRVRGAFGDLAAKWFVAISLGQFHVLFYASRFLPNMFAFGLTTVAFAIGLPGKEGKVSAGQRGLRMGLVVMAGVIWRSELVLLLAAYGAWYLLIDRVSLWSLLRPIISAAFVALAVSVPVDSYFWQRPVWPEFEAFWFNAVEGSSSQWGVEVWHWYFSSALPRLVLNPVVLGLFIPYALWNPATRYVARMLLVPQVLFIAVYSVLPHKETRFIIYTVPALTTVAALGAARLTASAGKSITGIISLVVLLGTMILSMGTATTMLLASSLNYPGGDALHALYPLIHEDPYAPKFARAHTDVLACMTGVTLFGTNPYGLHKMTPEQRGVVRFDKTEDPTMAKNPLWWDKWDYLVLETGKMPPGLWEKMATVKGWAGVEVIKPGMKVVDDVWVVGRGKLIQQVRRFVLEKSGGWWIGPRMEDKIWILQRKRGTRGIHQQFD